MSLLPEPELWSDETIAEFHLNNAIGADEYRWAVNEVLSMGIDPTRLNPDHLILEEPWQNPILYLPTSSEKHSS